MKIYGVILLNVCFLYGCATSVDTDYNPNIDFIGFKSYQWQPIDLRQYDDPRLNSNLLHQRIRQAINTALNRKGFILLAKGRPDFYINYHVMIEKLTDVDTVGVGLGHHYRHYGLGLGTEIIVSEYDESTLMIDVIDPDTRKILWRGSLGERVTRSDSVADKNSKVQALVNTILSEFPPKLSL